MVDKCVCCGEIVPEGLMVCPVCEQQAEQRKNKFIFVCSPLRGNTIENIHFAIERCREIALLGFIPIAPHLYFTRFLRDENEQERRLGIAYGIAKITALLTIRLSKNISFVSEVQQ